MEQGFDKQAYVTSFESKLSEYENHPLNHYQPTKFRFAGLGGQSKVLSFYSELLKKDLVVKIYPSLYEEDAKNEYDNMLLLEHENILKVYDFRRIYIEQEAGDGESSGSLELDGDEEAKSSDKKQHFANILIVMEKADKNLKQVIDKRKAAGKVFDKG